MCVRWGDRVQESCFSMSFRCMCIFHECYLGSEQYEIRAGVILSLHLPFSMECGLVHVKGQP